MRPGQMIGQPSPIIGLEAPPDLVELLVAIADDLAGLEYVPEVGGQFKQGQRATCYLLVRGRVVLQ